MAEYTFPIRGWRGNVRATYHTQGGTDLFAVRGTPVVSVTSGVVRERYVNHPLGGNAVTIRGDDGRDYYYAHFDGAPLVNVGQRVGTGQQIGAVGNSGNANSTPPHLHIGIGYGISGGSGAGGGTGINFDAQTFLANLLAQAGDVAQRVGDTVGDAIAAAGGAISNPINAAGQVVSGIGTNILQTGTSQLWTQFISFLQNMVQNFTVQALIQGADIIFIGIGILFIIIAIAALAFSTVGGNIQRVTRGSDERSIENLAMMLRGQ